MQSTSGAHSYPLPTATIIQCRLSDPIWSAMRENPKLNHSLHVLQLIRSIRTPSAPEKLSLNLMEQILQSFTSASAERTQIMLRRIHYYTLQAESEIV